MSWTLCIDFGTAFSKAALAPSDAWRDFDPASIRPLMLGDAASGGNVFLLDSAVFVDENRVLLGREAVLRADALAHLKRSALRSFKTLLSASDLDRALSTRAPLSVDPHRLFQLRDLIVLYLAFLLASIDRAIATDSELAGAAISERRYAAPAWRAGDSAGLHAIIVGLFAEAEALRVALGPALLSQAGIALQPLQDALISARTAPRPQAMGLVFEATAAAAYSSIGLESAAPAIIVLDMGAGTTDIAAIARDGHAVHELDEARFTLKQAGDFVDGVLANLVVDSSGVKGAAQQTVVWRSAMGQMRDFKETLFIDGRASLRFDRKIITVSMKELERHQDFRAFQRELFDAYAESLDVARHYVSAHGGKVLDAVAVGGGAAAPFIQNAIRTKPRGGKVRVNARSATPDWAHAPAFAGNLAPVFPQLAIAIGGALAPAAMLASRT